ncbi:MAG: retroviral-like aspartic protease family protein [Bacteroidales bacterium]|nr:retroviral-like aspartic protease family protein [Bacteroidales bacterium]
MKRIIMLALAVLGLALHPLSAQNTEGSDNYKYHKAVEILDEGGDPQEARKLAVENIKVNPKHIDSYLLIAGIDRREADYASALRQVDLAIKNNHKNSGFSEALLLWWKGIIYDELGDSRRAVDTMEQVVKLARKTDKEHLVSMMEDLAQFRYDLKDYDASDAVYREIMKIDESTLLPRIGLSRNLIAREKYDEALVVLEECRKYDRDYSEIYRFQMQAYEGKKEYKKMIDAMMTLFEKSDDADYIDIDKLMMDVKYSVALLKEKVASESDNALWKVVLASVYQESHMYPDVVAILDGLIEEYGYDEDILEERADCYIEMGMPDLALADMNKVLDICDERNHAYYYTRRGDVYRSAGMYEEAVQDFSRLIDRFPTRAYGYYARGWCRELSGDRDGAMKDYDEGISVDEDYPYIYLMRGTLYHEDGEMEKAMADFEAVVAKDTTVEDGSCRHYALSFLGREDEAIEWMEKIIGLDPDDPGNWYDKACLLARMGRFDESVSALRTACEKGFRRFPHVEHDNDMDPIRGRDDFKALMREYSIILEQEKQRIGKTTDDAEDIKVSEIAMTRMRGGTYEVPCSVNGLPLKMIFDTGASDVTISSVEASFMLKNGYLSDSDVKGKKHYMTASGDIHEGTILKLKEVKLGDAVLKNIEASVVHSQKAPLLLGQSVLEKFGTITIDNVNSKLLIKQ